MTKITDFKEVLQPLTSKELEYSVDSVALMIPLDLIEITHPTLNAMTVNVNIETGETDNTSYKKHSLKLEFEETNKIHFRIVTFNTGKSDRDNAQIFIKCLSIGLNSKFINELYFEGIRKEHCNIIYTKLMSLNVFKCSLDDLTRCSFVDDIDVKKDDYIELLEYKALTKVLREMTPTSKNNSEGCNRFNDKTNRGIEFNKRTKSSATKPFLKTYRKELELLYSDSNDFYEANLKNRDIKDLSRVEFNIRTRHMKKVYGAKMTTFEELMETSQEEFKRLHQRIVKQVFKNSVMSLKTTEKDDSKFNPRDAAICYLIESCLDNGSTIDLIIYNILNRMKNANQRSLMKKHIIKLYNENIKDIKPFKAAKNMEETLSFFSGGSKSFFNEGFDSQIE